MDISPPTPPGAPRADRASLTDGVQCGALIYDQRRAIWLYPAGYDDAAVCLRNRAAGLSHTWGVQFLCGWFEAATLATPIPGYYAYTRADPRSALDDRWRHWQDWQEAR